MDARLMERVALSAYRVSVQECDWTQLLEEVRTMLDARAAILVTPDAESRMMIGSPGFSGEFRDKLIAMPINPWRDRLRELRMPRPSGVCRIGSSYLPMRDLRRSGYYEMVDKAIQAGPLMTLHVDGDDSAALAPRTSLIVVRGCGERDFTDGAAQLLQALHVPLRAAVRSYWALERIRELERAPEIAYRVLPEAVLVLRADGAVEYANPAADAILARGELLAAANGQLVRAGSFGPDKVRLLLSAALRGVAQQVGICADGRSGSAAGVLHLMPLPRDTAFEARWPHGSILATLQLRPVVESGVKLPLVARRFGLTGAEADVLRGLSSGASAKQIAEHRQAQVSTVRTQIRGLLEKTGSRRQADLVRLMLD
jgi:DNA-binding CsgD family transcriptional regulator/PAS domain-containing protein